VAIRGRTGRGTVTIEDVARLAGVSTATVSRALARPDLVRPETVRLVADAVKASGYTPNSSARSLRRQRTNMVLVVVPTIANQMYAHVLRGIDTGLAPAGYGVIIGNLDNAPDKEAHFVDLAFSRQVDGIMLLCGFVPRGRGRSLAETGLPMVSLCAPIPGAGLPEVYVDDAGAGLAAGRHLAGLGHRRLGYAAGPRGSVVDQTRWSFFRQGAVESGVDPADILRLEGLVESRFAYGSGLAAAEAFLALSSRPTAMFCASDEIAIGFLKVVRRAGLQVPRDVSLLGFDGIEQADFTDPVLSTFRQPRHDIGRVGAEVLLRLIAGEGLEGEREIRLPFELLQRESTAALPRRPALRSVADGEDRAR
jgi:LacI family transcriptional regulator, repressor for deo operon, udp, cdd, tsx, nupC, and nupG